MVDQQQKLPKKRQRTGFVIDPFLTEYQKHTGYRINDDDEAMETIHKHHSFLLKQMVEEREGVDWSQTHLWKHLAETYAEEVDILRTTVAQMEMNLPGQQSTSTSSAASSSADGEESSDNSADQPDEVDYQQSANTLGSDAESSPSGSESSDDSAVDEDWTKIIWDLLNVLRKVSSFNMRQCGIDTLSKELQKSASFPHSQRAALKAIERSAEPLLRLMNEAKLRKKFNWSTRQIYNELEATLAGEVAADVIKTPATGKGGKGAQRHRMKSVLRPSGAGKARKRTRGVMDSQDEEEDMIDSPNPISSPMAKRSIPPALLARRVRELTVDSAVSREDSPSRQLNGHYDPHALPELPPGPEAQEMLDLVAQEAKRVGRQHQTSHLAAFLEQMITE
jgi:hypothetical protein